MKYLRAYSILLIFILWAPLVFIIQKGVFALPSLFENFEILLTFRNSLVLAAGSSLLACAMALATAFAIPHFPPSMRTFLMGSLILPLVIPEIAFGLAHLVWYQLLGLPLGWGTLFASHVGFIFSYCVLILNTSVAKLDLTLVDAAQDLGASPILVFRHALLPQLLPGLLAAFVMAFSLSLDDFLVSFLVKGFDQMTLPIKIYSMMRLNIGPEIYALSVVLFGISVVAVVITQLWHSKQSRH